MKKVYYTHKSSGMVGLKKSEGSQTIIKLWLKGGAQTFKKKNESNKR